MGLKLDRNKVSSEHSRMMSEANYLTKKSAANMAAIFRVRAYAFSPYTPPPLPLSVNPKRRTTQPDVVDDRDAIA